MNNGQTTWNVQRNEKLLFSKNKRKKQQKLRIQNRSNDLDRSGTVSELFVVINDFIERTILLNKQFS